MVSLFTSCRFSILSGDWESIFSLQNKDRVTLYIHSYTSIVTYSEGYRQHWKCWLGHKQSHQPVAVAQWWRIRLQCRRPRFDPWVRKIPWGGQGKSLQCSCLENPMDRGGRQSRVHRVAQSQTWLKWLRTRTKPYLEEVSWWKQYRMIYDYTRTSWNINSLGGMAPEVTLGLDVELTIWYTEGTEPDLNCPLDFSSAQVLSNYEVDPNTKTCIECVV